MLRVLRCNLGSNREKKCAILMDLFVSEKAFSEHTLQYVTFLLWSILLNTLYKCNTRCISSRFRVHISYRHFTENSMALKSSVLATTNLIHCCKNCISCSCKPQNHLNFYKLMSNSMLFVHTTV